MNVKLINIIIFILILVLLPRLLTSLGFPKIIVFLHFFFTCSVFGLLFQKIVSIQDNRKLLVIIVMFVFICFLSFIWNQAGIINFILGNLLLVSPFMFFLISQSFVWDEQDLYRMEVFIFTFILIHLLFSFFQYFVLDLKHDDVEGVFLGMGAGGHLAGAIATLSIFWLYRISWISKVFKGFLAVCLLSVLILSDSKQVIVVLGLSLGIYVIVASKGFFEKIKLVLLGLSSITLLYIVAITIFPGLLIYLQDDKILVGLLQKFSVFPRVIELYEDNLNWLIGVGPGHSVSRLGTMLPDYSILTEGLGATQSNVTENILAAKQNHYLSNSVSGSSLFALEFTFAGVWGDYGVLGLFLYICILVKIWQVYCNKIKVAKYLIITIFVYGVVFTWVEEPPFMFFIFAYISYTMQQTRFLNIRKSTSTY
jgi:hypothetical protein